MNVVCLLVIFGMQMVKDVVLFGFVWVVLVVNLEICFGYLVWEDWDCYFIFGDVCIVIVVESLEISKSE